MSKDKKPRAPRLKVSLLLSSQTKKNDSYYMTQNISKSGFFVLCSEPEKLVKVDDEYQFATFLFETDDPKTLVQEGTTITITAKVIRIDDNGFAVKIINFFENSESTYMSWLNKKI